MKNFRFLKQPLFNAASMKRRWSVDGGSMEDQTPRNCRIAELQNCRIAHLHICKTARGYFARVAAMLLMLVTMSVGQVWADKTIYLNTGGASLWNQASATFWVHAWGSCGTDKKMTLVEGDLYSVDICDGATSIIFLREKPDATSVVWNNNDGMWNKTGDLSIPNGKNCFTMTDWSNGSWSTYSPVVPETKYAVTISAGAGGSVSPSGSQQIGATGINITATPSDGYKFVRWEVSGGAHVASSTDRTTKLTADATGSVTAIWAEVEYVYFYAGLNNTWDDSKTTLKIGSSSGSVVTPYDNTTLGHNNGNKNATPCQQLYETYAATSHYNNGKNYNVYIYRVPVEQVGQNVYLGHSSWTFDKSIGTIAAGAIYTLTDGGNGGTYMTAPNIAVTSMTRGAASMQANAATVMGTANVYGSSVSNLYTAGHDMIITTYTLSNITDGSSEVIEPNVEESYANGVLSRTITIPESKLVTGKTYTLTMKLADKTTGKISVSGTSDEFLVASSTRSVNLEVDGACAGWGTVSPSSIEDVDDGTSISADGATLTIGSNNITAIPAAATAEYTYAVASPAWTWTESLSKVTKNITATAHFVRIPQTYTVTLDKGEHGAANQTFTATYNSREKIGYTAVAPDGEYYLRGYYDGDTKVMDHSGNFIANVDGYTDANHLWIATEDKTLTAKWEATGYYLNINLTPVGEGDANWKKLYFNDGTLIQTLAANKKYEFSLRKLTTSTESWYGVDWSGQNVQMVTNSAKWTFYSGQANCHLQTDNAGEYKMVVTDGANPKIQFLYPRTLTYTASDKTSGDVPAAVNNKYVGDEITLADGGNLTKTNCDFAGWNDGSADYAAGDTYTMTDANATLAAKWNEHSYTVTVQYQWNNTNIHDAISPVVSAIMGMAFTPEDIDGYTFKGWTLNGVAEKSAEGNTITITAAAAGGVLTATYRKNNTITAWTAEPVNGYMGGSMTIGATAANGIPVFTSSNANITIDGTTMTYAQPGKANITATVAQTDLWTGATLTKNNVKVTGCYMQGRLPKLFGASSDGGWSGTGITDVPFDYSDGLFVLNTNKTVGELSGKIDNQDPWFHVALYDGTTWTHYNAGKNANFSAKSEDCMSVDLQTGKSQNVKFNDTSDPAENVVLYFNPQTPYTISYTAGYTPNNITCRVPAGHGTLVSDKETATPGENYLLTATPAAGYYLSEILGGEEDFTNQFQRNEETGIYTFNATMETTDETWNATFSPIQVTPVVNGGEAVRPGAENVLVVPGYSPVAPKGSLVFCYTLQKQNGGNWDNTDVTFSQVSTSANVTFTAPMVEGTYRVATVVKSGATCESATVIEGAGQNSAEFRIVNQYTITYGAGANGSLAGAVSEEAIDASPAQVNGGSTVVFTASPSSGYQVQGWYADAQFTQPLAAASNTYTIENLSADASVYVKFFAPRTATIATKDGNTDCTAFLVGETVKVVPSTTAAGAGSKVYCWSVEKQNGEAWMPYSTHFTSAGNGAVTFTAPEVGTYRAILNIYDGSCDGDFNSTATSANFTVSEHEYYIVGSYFWGTSAQNLSDLTPSSKGCESKYEVYLNPTYADGEYYWRKWTFATNYDIFWIYDKAKNKAYSGHTNGWYAIGSDHNTYETGIDLQAVNSIVTTAGNENGFYTYNRQGQAGHSDLGRSDWYIHVKNGKIWFTSEAPDMTPNLRLKISYTDSEGAHTYYSNDVKDVAYDDEKREWLQSSLISFYAPAAGATYTLQKEELGRGWVNQTPSLAPGITKAGVYTAVFTKSGDNQSTAYELANISEYTSTFYIRSAAVKGGWNNYMAETENRMRYTDRANGNAFDHFVCKYCSKITQDVRFCVANTINPSLTDTLIGDNYINEDGTLPSQAASVRFMYNSKTNKISRAYLQAATETPDFLLLMVDDSQDAKKIYKAATGATEIANPTRFDDLEDWNYTIAEIYAEAGAKVAVRAKYKNKYQFFFGDGTKEDVGAGDVTTYEYLIGNNVSTGDTRYKMRIVYDFKVDRLVTGWIPDGDAPLTESIAANCDILIIREHNNQPNTIRFSEAGITNHAVVSEVKTVYGVLQLNKSEMTPFEHWFAYEKYQMYWISFPFDVRVGAIFGISGYGTNWKIMKYNGEKRAQIGWFAETETFWEDMTEDEVMEANRGYLVNLSFMYFANPNSEVWANGVTSASLYFPSQKNVGTISTQPLATSVHEHECTIDRAFENYPEKNHKTEDSNWNIIGIPSFQTLRGNGQLTNQNFYVWSVDEQGQQTYIATAADSYEFMPTMGYMVQYGGELNWPEGSTPVSPTLAPRRVASVDNYNMELQLTDDNEKMLDRTYIRLKYEASEYFVLNEDMSKIDNPKYNIYSRCADGYPAAISEMPVQNQTIELVVDVATAQNYTFHMMNPVSCDVKLLDREEGTVTDLNMNDYTIFLTDEKYDGRFALVLTTSNRVVTGAENVMADGTKIQKFLKNGLLYILRDGKIYDAQGRITK